MATYTKTTNFTAKDNLTSGDPAKVIKGSEFDTEFNAIETAVNSKADKNNGVHTGTTTISTANIDTLQIDSVAVTATAAEINTLDGITASTAELNKLDGYTGDVTDLNKLAGVTATATEINVLDGSTATTADLNKLAGVTATSTELNLLDGVTATTTELNYVDGVTSNIQTQLDGKQPLDAQLTDIAGLTPTDGTFIVGDGTNFVAESGDTAIASLGVTATASELNTLDGITATTTELNYTDGVTSNIQTQLDTKAPIASPTFTGTTTIPTVDINGGTIDGVSITGTTASFSGEISANGGIALGDNDKATFGASDDLQIYHSGTHSFIRDEGAGDLYITTNGSKIDMMTNGLTEYGLRIFQDGEVGLYHDNSKKLATTSTGVDVTGTVTADGLTNAGSFVQAGALDHASSGGLNIKAGLNNASISNSTDCYIGTHTSGGMGVTSGDMVLIPRSNANSAVQIVTGNGTPTKTATFSHNGNVSFYEDTGTTAKMVWDASEESLGIGTLSPQTPIEISGPKNTSAIRLRSTTNDASWSSGDYFGRLEFWSNDASGAGAGAKGSIVTATTGGSGGANYMAFNVASTATNDIERMRIDSSGNVGIGTSSPTTKLEVQENTNSTDVQIRLRSFNSLSAGRSAYISYNPDDRILGLGEGGDEVNIDSSGNVGIGTASPQNHLEISKATPTIRLTNTDGSGNLQIAHTGSSYSYGGVGANQPIIYSVDDISIMADGSHNLKLHTNSAERARIDSSGNLLVGTTSARGEGVVSKKGINYRSSNNSINGVQTYTRTYVSDQNNWRTILTRGTNTQGIAEVTVYTSYATPASIGSITRVLVLPNQTYTVISQEGSSTNGYSSMEFQWVGDDFQVRTVAQYLSYTCLVLLSDSGANLWPSQS